MAASSTEVRGLEARARRPIRTRPPGPRGHPLFGNTPALRRGPIPTLMQGWRQFGDVVYFPLGGPFGIYLLAHPDHVKHVLQEEHQNYGKVPWYNSKLKALIGEGLVTSEGDLWLRQRRLAQPAFHRQRIAAMATLMTDATEAMLRQWHVDAQQGKPVDVAAEMMRLTLGIVAKALFSTDVSRDVDVVRSAVPVVVEHIVRRMQSYVDLARWLPPYRRFLAARASLDAVVYRIIAERRRSAEETGDLLSMLLAARDEETGAAMTDQQLRDEVMTIFLAGHDTTALTLTWAWYLLSRHPDVARRLRAELAQALGGRPPTMEDLPRLPYLDMVIQEVLRLYPPAWAMHRSPHVDDEVGGYRIPAGAAVLLSQYVTHRHPEFWENPEGFDPERFTPERSADRPRFAYFPFGGGPRQCIGAGFALMEAQLILATVAQHYDLALVPGHPVALKTLITLRPRYGMLMRLTRKAP